MTKNGKEGYLIKKSTFTFIMVIIALISCIGTVVAYTVTIRSDVNYLKQECDLAGPRQQENIQQLQENIQNNQNTIIQNQERIIAIQDDISEIKTNIKEILTK